MISIAEKRKTTTSTEVKNRWNAKTYKRYTVSLRYEEDASYIDFVEENKNNYTLAEIFKVGIDTIKKEGLN